MGIHNLTALIIASRPDVVVSSAFVSGSGKHVGWITLGPEDRYRPLLNTEPIYDSAEQAQDAMRQLITEIRDKVNRVPEADQSLPDAHQAREVDRAT